MYTPGWLGSAQPAPQLTTPTSLHTLSSWQTKGPPLSPWRGRHKHSIQTPASLITIVFFAVNDSLKQFCKVLWKCNNKKKHLTWHASTFPSVYPAQSIREVISPSYMQELLHFFVLIIGTGASFRVSGEWTEIKDTSDSSFKALGTLYHCV